jgi:hypothetical protein
MGLSRMRWFLAAALGLLALVAAMQATWTYIKYDLRIGVASVLALAITLLVGLGSLWWARVRIGFELAALRGLPAGATAPDGSAPASSLLRGRRERLQAIRAAGVRPDRQVLADATSAEEAGRAYIGRYFVATTVLIGLVGTFAGLMATLSKVAPLLHEKESGALALLAEPLAGLHVTFGASLVAILSTLALVLAQGDLALHEEQALTMLEDRTTHSLIPELWPPEEEPAERTVRAVAELRTMLAGAVAQALEHSAARMAETARGEAERAARALDATARTVERQISQLGVTVGGALEKTASSLEKQLGQLGVAVGGVLQNSAGSAEQQVIQLYSNVQGALETSMTSLEQRITQLTSSVTGALQTSVGAMEEQITQLNSMVGGALQTSVGSLEAQISQLNTTVSESLQANLGSAEQQISQLTSTVGDTLQANLSTAEQQMSQLTTAVRETLQTNLSGAEQQIQQLASTVRGTLESSASTVERHMAQLTAAVGGALESATERQTAAMDQATRALTAQASASSEETVRRATALAEESVRATTAELGRTLQPMLAAETERLELAKEAFGQTAAGIQQATARMVELQAALEGGARAQVAAIEGAGQSVLAAFDRAVLGAGQSLDGAAGKLAGAANQLSGGFETFSPKIAALSTELGALGRELALQAARGPEGDLGAVVLSELERIGAGLDRLAQLQRLAGGGTGFGAQPAAELGAAPSAESFGADATEETHS